MRAFAGLILASTLAAQAPVVELREVVTEVRDVVTDIRQPPGDSRLFILGRSGGIRIVEGVTFLQEPFLDLRAKVGWASERGLLGLAFPPGFAAKQYFYVCYSDLQGDTTISRFRVTQDRNRADPNSETVLLKIPQPYAIHKGGQLLFGPDGYLYIPTGDGGGVGDPENYGQNPRSLLGKVLRYDSESDLARLRVPGDNPFVNDADYDPAIWALGLRNPWRFSFDRETGDQWVADVGQDRAEEINFQPAGRGGQNYGWNPMEGLQCYLPGCDPERYTLPVHEYGHADGCSVTGGFVYRGPALPALRGQYIYGDYCRGHIWALRREGDGWVNRELLRINGNITTFGEDTEGELYVGTAGGSVLRFAAPGDGPAVLAAVNAASFAPGLVAGSIATAFVSGIIDANGVVEATAIPLPATLDGVSVTVNGRAAPLYSAARTDAGEQVNFQVPFEMAGADRLSIVVRRRERATALFDAPLVSAEPGVFTIDGTRAVVLRSDGNRLVTPSEQLAAGEFVCFYATGLGPVTNPPATGAASPREPLSHAVVTPTVTLGGVPAEVLFAGLAPDFVGLFQVNIRVPAGAPAGSVELVVETDGVGSRPARVLVR